MVITTEYIELFILRIYQCQLVKYETLTYSKYLFLSWDIWELGLQIFILQYNI